ncbi:N-acetylmuramoyl-L-alanine amidase [Thermomonas sp. S9]|nr:N-acetylmuramoyl-L-alanine amidase [Thermomonas sp. S9]
MRIESGPTGTRAELHLDKMGEYRLIPLSNPERLAVDFPDSHLARGLTLPGAAGMVKAVRTGQPAPGTLRVVFDLAGKVKAIPTTLDGAASGAVLVLEWPGDGPAPAQAVASAPAPAAPSGSAPSAAPGAAPSDPIAAFAQHPLPASVNPGPASAAPALAAPAPAVVESVPTPADPPLPPPPRPALQAGMRPLVVAIDAGHGGQDPGARGPGGTREKDVTLAIARELARQVNATPGLKAYLTRDSDVFIPLEYRARRASANKADIFISIHADAAENRGARGSSVYILSTRGASSQRARWLADKENAADVIGGARVRVADSTLTSVLLDLTQSGNMKASEDAAQHVLGGLKRVGNNHKPDIERANFAVLRTSDKMPAMLVETAFISNPEEEKRLTDPAFQRTLARAILDGVDTYFSRQPPPGTLYAARAQAAQSAQAMDVPRSGIGSR